MVVISEILPPQDAAAFSATVPDATEPIEQTHEGRLILPDSLKTPDQILASIDGNIVFIARFESTPEARHQATILISKHGAGGWHKYRMEHVASVTQEDLDKHVQWLKGPHSFEHDLLHALSGVVDTHMVVRRKKDQPLERSREYMHVLRQTDTRTALALNYTLTDEGEAEIIAIISGDDLGLEHASTIPLEQSPLQR